MLVADREPEVSAQVIELPIASQAPSDAVVTHQSTLFTYSNHLTSPFYSDNQLFI
jgi:hypothetical protein